MFQRARRAGARCARKKMRKLESLAVGGTFHGGKRDELMRACRGASTWDCLGEKGVFRKGVRARVGRIYMLQHHHHGGLMASACCCLDRVRACGARMRARRVRKGCRENDSVLFKKHVRRKKRGARGGRGREGERKGERKKTTGPPLLVFVVVCVCVCLRARGGARSELILHRALLSTQS